MKNLSDTTVSIILMIISGFSFVVMHSAAKFLSDQIHIFEITFLRCALVAVVLAPMIFKEGKSSLITKQPKFQIYRIITNSIAMLCFFYGLTLTTLAEVTALNLTVPIFTTLLAFLFLNEKLKKHRLSALFIGFLGAIIVLRPDIYINIGGVLILISALIWSVSLIFIKKLTETDTPVTISLYAGVGMIPATFVAAYPYLTMPNLYQFLIILFIAVTGTIAQTLLNSAFKRGQLAILLPFDYLKLIWSVLIGYTIFVESTTISLWIGGTLIVGASSYIAWRERN
jgi:drug/metabolite transporter (DMT)-like permease